MKKTFILLVSLCLTAIGTAQQKKHFEAEVEAIKNYEKIYAAPENPIVFTGSSSIRKWNHLQVAFGPYNVINRGVGGAVTDDITFHVNDLIFKYNPRQIVLYVGENDLVNENNTAEIILNKTVALYNAIRTKMPEVPIVYISMKPSPSREKHQQKCKAANELIRKFLATQKNAKYLDVFTPMLKDGKTRPELFVEDMLHLNAKGYDLWEKLIAPYLLKQTK